jgi:hypothetical protein
MNNKPRKILNISTDDNNLLVDIRIAIPKENCSEEFIDDIIRMKTKMVEGHIHHLNTGDFLQESWVEVAANEDGSDRLLFTKTIKELNENNTHD